MSELPIKKSTTPEEFEKLLTTPNLGEKTLVIPNSLSHAGTLGCSMAFAQFLLTWSRKSEQKRIQTFLKTKDTSEHIKFTQRIHGFATAYYSDWLSAHDDPNTNLRTDLLRSASERIRAMHLGDMKNTGRGREIELIFIAGAKQEFHGSLYTKAPNAIELADPEAHGQLIRTKEQLNNVFARFFNFLKVYETLSKHLQGKDLPFGSLLSEAFRNTAEHAYTEPGGSKIPRNLRCVRLANTQVARERLKSFSIGTSNTRSSSQEYFTQLSKRFRDRTGPNIDFLELSILDSGSGYSRTMGTREDNKGLSDVELVRKCFIKHQSSKPPEVSGVGIYRMLSAVAELEGFIRIRTSSVEAFYCGIDGKPDNLDLNKVVCGDMAPVEGTLITVGIPVAF